MPKFDHGGKYDDRLHKKDVETFNLNDSEYADDTMLNFTERLQLASWAPDLYQTFADCGMEIHVKKPGDKKAKTVALFVPAQGCEYDRFHSDVGGAGTYGGEDLSDIPIKVGDIEGVIPVVEKAVYLGGVIDKNLNHETAVDARISKASAAFGKLKGYVFASKDISLPAKRAAYVALVLSILLYGCECWAITASMRRKVQSFHNRCSRIMCGINMWHVKEQHIKTDSVLEQLGLRSVGIYMARRRLRWLGHVRRMDWSRLPRKLLSSWVYQARPLGRPRKRWAESIEDDIKTAGLTFSNWHEKANEENKLEWKNRIKKLGEPRKKLSGMNKTKKTKKQTN